MAKQSLSLTRKLNIIRGQIDGIAGMIEEGKADAAILVQIKAAKSGLNSISSDILKSYLQDLSKNKKKREELAKILRKYL